MVTQGLSGEPQAGAYLLSTGLKCRQLALMIRGPPGNWGWDGGGRGGNIKVPGAQLGSGEKLWTGRILEAGEKEGNWSQEVARGRGDPKRILNTAVQVSPIALEMTLRFITEDASQGPPQARMWSGRDRPGQEPGMGRPGVGWGHQRDIFLHWFLGLMAGGAGLSGGSTDKPPGFQLTSRSQQPQTITKPHHSQAPTR